MSSTVTAIGQQVELFLIRWTFMALRDFLTAALKSRSKSWDHWQDRWSSYQLIWNIPAKFPIHLFTAVVQNSTKGFSTGLWEVRPKQQNSLVEPNLNSGNFSQVSWKTEVHVMNLLPGIETVTCTDCLNLYQQVFCSLCRRKNLYLISVLADVWRGGVVVTLVPSVEKASPGCYFLDCWENFAGSLLGFLAPVNYSDHTYKHM